MSVAERLDNYGGYSMSVAEKGVRLKGAIV